jgi:hypothetical protein
MYTSSMMAALHDYMVRTAEEAYTEWGDYIEQEFYEEYKQPAVCDNTAD